MSFSYVVDPQWIERIAYAHRDKGVAAVILHGATHSYRRSTTLAWKELMGAASMRHDTQREFPRLERLAADNPIVKTLPKEWGPGSDELYNIDRTWPTATPLLQAWSIEGEKHHPIAWTNTFGKAKVFVTTMGHTNRTMTDPVYLDLVTRGLLWTVGKLAPDGTPVAGYGPQHPDARRYGGPGVRRRGTADASSALQLHRNRTATATAFHAEARRTREDREGLGAMQAGCGPQSLLLWESWMARSAAPVRPLDPESSSPRPPRLRVNHWRDGLPRRRVKQQAGSSRTESESNERPREAIAARGRSNPPDSRIRAPALPPRRPPTSIAPLSLSSAVSA